MWTRLRCESQQATVWHLGQPVGGMKTGGRTSGIDAPERRPPASRPERMAAIGEVVLAFALVHAAFRAFKQFTGLGRWESAAHLNFTPGR